MAIRFKCGCGQTLQAKDEHVGKSVLCTKCNTKRKVPPPEEASSPVRVMKDSERSAGDKKASANTVQATKQVAPPPLPPPEPIIEEIEVLDLSDGREYSHPSDNPDDADFFCPAPSEIGRVLSAHTSLIKGNAGKPLALRLLIPVGIGVAIACVPGLLLGICSGSLIVGAIAFFFFGIIVTPIAIGVTLLLTHFRHYCGYVGEKGVALFTCSGSRDRVTGKQTFLFGDADELRIAATHLYRQPGPGRGGVVDIGILLYTKGKGHYQGTTYSYTWTDEESKRVFTINGHHMAENKLPPRHDKYHLARAADVAWSQHVLSRVLPRIRAGKTYTFWLKGDSGVDFHDGFLELHVKGKTQRFYPEDLAGIRLKDGTISLKEPGAKEGWFTSSGFHNIPFRDLGNAKVFLLLMDRVYGVAMDG